MKQYSADLRERLLGAIDAGFPQAEAARLFGVVSARSSGGDGGARDGGCGLRRDPDGDDGSPRTPSGPGGPGSRRPGCHARRALRAVGG